MAGERKKHGRADLGDSETVALKLHPDLMAWVAAEAARSYCSKQEVIRRLIVQARLKDQG